jgi:hypothetical protein
MPCSSDKFGLFLFAYLSASIFQQCATPDGAKLVQWLVNPMHVPAFGNPPMQHRHSVLDGYLHENEGKTRQLRVNALMERTVWASWLFWRVWMVNWNLTKL